LGSPLKKSPEPIRKKKYIEPEKEESKPPIAIQEPVIQIDDEKSKGVAKPEQESVPEKGSSKNPVSTELNLERVKDRWPSIMEKIHLERPSIGSIIEECDPVELDGDKLIIKFFGKSEFSVKMAERGISTIEKVIADEMGLPLKINFLNGGRDTPPQSETNQKKLDPHPNDEKLFNKIVEVFDGEILR